MTTPTEEALRHLRRSIPPLLETVTNDEQLVALLRVVAAEVERESRDAQVFF